MEAMELSDADALSRALTPVLFMWIMEYFEVSNYDQFDTCKRACAKMGQLLDLQGRRICYAILGAAFTGASLGDRGEHPQHVTWFPAADWIHEGRPQIPLHMAVRELDEEAVSTWMSELGTLAGMMNRVAAFATSINDLNEAAFFQDCRSKIVEDNVLARAGRARNRALTTYPALSP